MARIVRELPKEVAAYIAGLIDGEGTVTLTRTHSNERRRLVVSIANTELPLLQFVHQQTGVGKITRKRTVSERHTPSFCYAVSSRQALALLHQLEPHMHSYKRRRAQLALLSYLAVTPRNGRYSKELANARMAFERVFLQTIPLPTARDSTEGPPETAPQRPRRIQRSIFT